MNLIKADGYLSGEFIFLTLFVPCLLGKKIGIKLRNTKFTSGKLRLKSVGKWCQLETPLPDLNDAMFMVNPKFYFRFDNFFYLQNGSKRAHWYLNIVA